MSKELEIIKELRCLVYSCQDSGFITNAEKHFLPLLECLESTLKDYEDIKPTIDLIDNGKLLMFDEKQYEQITKNNRALEIIKNNFEISKPIGIDTENNRVSFGCILQKKDLTQEEYELLKEVLE